MLRSHIHIRDFALAQTDGTEPRASLGHGNQELIDRTGSIGGDN